MSSFAKKVLIFILIPLGVLGLCSMFGRNGEGFLTGLAFIGFLLIGYFFASVVMFIANRNEIAKALLLATGIILLVGLSICGIILGGS
ncbi:hypothetical protein DVR12_25835 [Chitinophaga silvatica]|uniref:Uncharacterized protein n=1 Tax=Chitinophaga silvatica TaxID=2282649 RepID=A0A3E1Y2Z7_9BACT|nr:hypothetical protein [Chitinophaga silvatica]RFS19024.1 hypothetical protein DVR12_25835 [Chitinophaga silvatica]